MSEAADLLGIKEGAVRSRIKRGTLPTVKEGDRVYVVFGGGTSEADHAVDPEGPPGEPPEDRAELVEELRDRIAYLERQVEEEREARRRADGLLLRFVERVPELTAAPDQDAPGARESAADRPSTKNTPPDHAEPETAAQPRPRSWWRRILGG